MPTTPSTPLPAIHLFNTWSRKDELFTPIHAGKVGIYTCGPTVYHFAHIGNMRAYIFADTLRRMFEFAGYHVTHVMNLTDVGHLTSDGDVGEDKMLVAMRREGLTAWDIAQKYSDAFFKHAQLLNIKRPTEVAKATDHIAEQIAMVQQLEAKGYTYKTSDGIYFDTAKLDDYGHLARLDVAGLQAGERVEMGEKKNLTDFALWKFSPADAQRDMEWDSPWGKGFPGWHIECSAMAQKYLGKHFDIHTGGIDHIPVHHTNEIAQSECANGCKSVNYWMHVEFLRLKDGVRMSKSSGDFMTVDTLVEKGYDPLAYRYMCLTSHYRSALNFDWEALDGAARGLRRLNERALKVAAEAAGQTPPHSAQAAAYRQSMATALFDDLGTPTVIASLWTLLDDDALAAADKLDLVRGFDAVLGLDLLEARTTEVDIPAEVAALVEQRTAARRDRNFLEADRIRDQIAALGYLVDDMPTGVQVRKVR